MLKYLKPRVIPITFVLFFLGIILTFIIAWGLLSYTAFEFLSVKIARVVMIIGFFPAFVATRLFYSSVLPIWIVYSIKKTENLHFLKYFLIQSKVINNKILEAEVDEIIRYKSLNFNALGFLDDLTVPNETVIKKSYADFFGILFCTLTLPILFYNSIPENRSFGYVLCVIGIIAGIRELIKLKKQKFSFKLSDEGVWISDSKLVTWSQIKKQKRSEEYKSDYTQRIAIDWYFIFDYTDSNDGIKEYKIKFNQLNINGGRLNYLIYIYRNRYLRNEKNNR